MSEMSRLDVEKQVKEKKLEVLTANGYLNPKWLPDGRWAAVMKFMYTSAIIVGVECDMEFGYSDRWCYHTLSDARKSLEEWDGEGEPQGWHRHPSTGRRFNEAGEAYVWL